ncbi:MAG: site-specific integrase [Paludibacteraceae bacterium]|nr:site-specific integrase [Paludibacteraceae bacterium]
MASTKSIYSFIYNRKRQKNGEKPIELRIYFPNKKMMYISTGIKILEKYWDNEEKRVNRSHPLYLEYNEALYKLRYKIEEYEYRCERDGGDFRKETITSMLNPSWQDNDFIDWCKGYNYQEEKAGIIKYESWQKYNSVINNLKIFSQSFLDKKGKLTFKTIQTKDFAENLEMEIYAHYKAEVGNKYITLLKKFFNEAQKKGLIEQNVIGLIRKRKVRTKSRRNLTEQELKRLEDIDRSELKKYDIITLDKFLFSCYTGLRISDNSALLKKDILKTENGLVIDIVTEKMQGQRVVLPIDLLFDGKAGAIARRYMEEYPDIKTLFPSLTDQHVNKHLKRIAFFASLDNERLTFHIARHTCATLIAEKSQNPFLIMSILGHADISTSMTYIHNSTAAMIKNLESVKW